MNNCGIVTGRREVVKNPDCTGSAEYKYDYVFDTKSENTISKPIYIDNNQIFKFSTFNLPDGVKLIFNRVQTGGGVMPQGSNCCVDTCGRKTVIISSEVFKIHCKPVVLNNCNSVLFLSVPGTYILELDTPSALGQFVVQAEPVEGFIPTSLIIGCEAPDHIVGVDEKLTVPAMPEGDS